MTEITSVHVEAGGLSIHYLQARADGGEGDDLPLVLLHGWPEFSGVWRKLTPMLAERHRVFAPDLRKFGKTTLLPGTPERPTDPVTLADDLIAFLDAVGLERVVLVTHDVGGYVGQEVARRAAERFAGLVFFDCPYPGIGPRGAAPEHLIEIWYQSFHRLPWATDLVGYNRDTCRIYFKNLLAHWAYDPHAFDDALEDWVDNFMAPGVLRGGFDWYEGVWQYRLKLLRGELPPTDPITVPTRVLWGAGDPVIKAEWADRLGETFADLELTIVPEAGHFPHWEKPAEMATEILDFIARRVA
jgi:pimeloyl-ACP methyl ester carboxylesterase